MRTIATPFFAKSPYLFGPLMAMLFFFAAFLVASVYALRMNRNKAEELSKMPLEKEKESDPSTGEK
ncbi:MAG: hypothetical protein NZM37_03060 [Sandaracinaceae bacterium]|nr:hypothetical protein [Sandaracinaceae bacterium]MDW8246123.1 hypothetical protein [Sandaracinaceae bacterium]